jgi:phosphoenolpyruvate-protein phosphotransferase (PTS system enzyme I)
VTRRSSSNERAAVGMVLHGIAGSPGVVVGSAVVVVRGERRYERRRVVAGEEQHEWRRFIEAVKKAQTDLRAMLDGFERDRAEASILEAYEMMLGDETLAAAVGRQIHERRRSAEWAVAAAVGEIGGRLVGADDPYVRERGHDIEFVGDLLLRALVGGAEPSSSAYPKEPAIIVAHDLSPADTAAMAGAPVLGFITEVGSRTSHTAIMARALEIPAVIGLHDALEHIDTGDKVILDGLRGRVIVNPVDEQIEDAERRAARHAALADELGTRRDDPAATKDAVRVVLHANIELPEEAALARRHGAEGVGLYRTEFLYVNQAAPPDEDQQLAVFRRVLEAMDGRPVTLRTFDIGGDKFVTSFQLPEELNPMLGLRAVRLGLSEPRLYREQLRAMLRASAFGKVRILVPLVATVGELRAVRDLVDEAKADLRARGEKFDDDIEIGAMIEVPAAAIMADALAVHADFFSIGTNDLVQYALAIDRTNRALAYLASPYDPAILRLVAGVVRAARHAERPLAVCGEMASDPLGALLLLGLGVRELSMESLAIPEIKEAMGRFEITELETLGRRVLEVASAAEVEALLATTIEPRVADLLHAGAIESSPGSFRKRQG